MMINFFFYRTCITSEAKYHNTPIKCINYSKDGKYLVTGDSLGNYNLYDTTRNYQVVKIFEAELESENIYAQFTYDSQTLATVGSYGNTINLWDLHTFYKRTTILVKNTTIRSIVFALDDSELYVISNDYKFRIYRVKNNDIVLYREINFNGKFKLLSLRPSNNKKYFIAGCDDNQIRLWDVYDNFLIYTNQGHIAPIRSAIFSNENTKIITGGGDEGVFIWTFKGDVNPLLLPDNLPSFSTIVNTNLVSIRNLNIAIPDTHNISKISEPFSVLPLKEEEEEENLSNIIEEEVKIIQEISIKSIKSEKEEPTNDKFFVPVVALNKYKKDTKEDQDQVFFNNVTKPAILHKKLSYKKFLQLSKGDASRKTQALKDYKYIKNRVREKNKLPFKHYALDHDSRFADSKVNHILQNQSPFSLNYIAGYNTDCHSNLIWNSRSGWVAYTVENYVVFDLLSAERKQKIITFKDYISVLALSKNGEYLAVGAGNITFYYDKKALFSNL